MPRRTAPMNGARSVQHAGDALLRQVRTAGESTDGSPVLVALSGGLDSVCLLHVLRFSPGPPPLVAAHFDHAMRADSARDADWVRGLCRAWAVPLLEGRATSALRGEAAARAARYRFLSRAADRAHATMIVTAHHADDQAETVLYRLARGTGLPGLAGIAPRRGRLRRPLLSVTRADMRAYARAYGLTWRDDPSNRDLRLARNRIRSAVLPELEALSPGAARRIAALAADAASAERAWRTIVAAALEDVVLNEDTHGFALATGPLLAYHPHVRARVVRHLLRRLGSRPGRAGTRSAMEFINSGTSGSRFELPGGVLLSREFERLLLRRAAPADAVADRSLEIGSAGPGSGSATVGGRHFVVRWTPTAAAATGLAAALDRAALRFPLVLRSWRAGDSIRLPAGRRKLKKLFVDRRIARSVRATLPVLCDADGRVLWVAGVAVDETVRARTSDNVFQISVVDGDTS